MTEASHGRSRSHVRHEYRTPVNHIIGYSELLMEDAGDRRLDRFIPVFQGFRKRGCELIEAIQNVFSDQNSEAKELELGNFKLKLKGAALEISRTMQSLREDLDRDHNQTIADLDAISWAAGRLLELAGMERIASTPKRIHPAHSMEHLRGSIVPTRRRGGTILIADDDSSNRNLLRRRLECENHAVLEAANGLEVLDILEKSTCDLLLLDILMPSMDGFQTLARLKQDIHLRDLPIVMISALDEMEGVVRCIEMGAEDYLTKPFNRVLLRARIDASLEKKWLRDRERQKAEELKQTLKLLEQAQKQLTLQASVDALTGLANRRTLEANLDSRVKQGTPFAAIYIDLNEFKRINDAFGHAAGDDVLKQVGNRLRQAFSVSDMIGRWGGDEFVAIADMGRGSDRMNISRIKDAFIDDFVISEGNAQHRVMVQAAVGVANWKAGDTVTKLLHRADLAMYEEKLRRAG